jgi:hypothetical protein
VGVVRWVHPCLLERLGSAWRRMSSIGLEATATVLRRNDPCVTFGRHPGPRRRDCLHTNLTCAPADAQPRRPQLDLPAHGAHFPLRGALQSLEPALSSKRRSGVVRSARSSLRSYPSNLTRVMPA